MVDFSIFYLLLNNKSPAKNNFLTTISQKTQPFSEAPQKSKMFTVFSVLLFLSTGFWSSLIRLIHHFTSGTRGYPLCLILYIFLIPQSVLVECV